MATGDVKHKVNKQENVDMQKFIKYLSLKSVQIIVQSRLGFKNKTKSKPNSIGSDWFNLALKDCPEVLAETKKAMGDNIPNQNLSLCIEISLKTAEGGSLVLEIWKLAILEACTKNGIHYVYNRMSVILKSLMCVTKVTPAFKFSCLQGPDSYVICYRVYMGDPDYSLLGKDLEEYTVGHVSTPLGGVNISLSYRTVLTIEPQVITPFMVTSNYFFEKTNSSNNCARRKEAGKINSDFCSEVEHDDITDSKTKSEKLNATTYQSDYDSRDIWDNNKVGAFVPSSQPPSLEDCLIPDSPFQHFLDHTNSPLMNSIDLNNNSGTNGNAQEDTTDRGNTSDSDNSIIEDFVLVELKPPFAEAGYNSLGTFFTELPPLQSFNQDLSLEEQVSEINFQLEHLESNCVVLDNFVDSLCQIEENA